MAPRIRTGDHSRCDAVGAITELFTEFGYAGYFDIDDIRRPIEEFDVAEYQNPADVDRPKDGWAIPGVDVNNGELGPSA